MRNIPVFETERKGELFAQTHDFVVKRQENCRFAVCLGDIGVHDFAAVVGDDVFDFRGIQNNGIFLRIEVCLFIGERYILGNDGIARRSDCILHVIISLKLTRRDYMRRNNEINK